MERNSYNPDVLNCIANLSNDEVFTPPELANKMLDLLPQKLFRSPETTFLDPVSKTGVFLREIVKRLDVGLENKIPDRQKRIDHILHKQVFGLAITELTSYISRRSLYYSKSADSKYSVSYFDSPQGNILYDNHVHTWVNGKCHFCGASQTVYDRGTEAEQYAYMFIHTGNPDQFFPEMKFDVIIGNPPYQLNDGGNKASANPIYQLFVQQALKLKPKYLLMIIPARWYSGGKRLDEFRYSILSNRHIRHLVDYFDSTECFPGVDLSGGVCYFLWDRDYTGPCEVKSIINGKETVTKRELLKKGCDTFIRFNQAITIIDKTYSSNNETFASIVSARKPFGIATNDKISQTKRPDDYFTYAYPKNGYINKNQIFPFSCSS